MVGHKELHSYHHESDRDHYVKYRSIVSSISFDLAKSDYDIRARNKWLHIGGNILRLPPIRKKFSLVNKANVGSTHNGIHSIALSPKGRHVAIGFDSGELQLRRLSSIVQDDAALRIRPACQAGELNSTVTCVRFVPTMENILFCSDISGRIDVFDSEKVCKHLMAREMNNQVNSIDVNGAGTTLLSGGKDSILRVYDTMTGKVLISTPPITKRDLYADPKKFHQMRIYCIKFDPENYNVFFSGGLDGYVKVWDIREGMKGVRTIIGPCLRGDAMDLWGNVLLTGSWRASKGMDLWDTISGQHLDTLVPTNRNSSLDAEFYECVRFFNGGKDGTIILAGGSGTGRIEVFNLIERRVDFAVKVGNSVKSIDSTFSNIVCGGLDGICRVIRYNRMEEKD